MARGRTTLFVFLTVCCYLGWISASRVFLGDNDEGIYMDAARRILAGQMPYKDFFAVTGPGSFFFIAASFRIFGITLAAARIPVIFDLAAMTSCVFWLTWKLAGRAAAIVAALAFVAFETLQQGLLANHRWDSSAWMTLAATLIFVALDQPDGKRAPWKKSAAFAAGFAATVAVFCTPPVALAGAALGACLLFAGVTGEKPPIPFVVRPFLIGLRSLADFLAGITVASALGAGFLASRGALGPMVRSMGWTMSNYTFHAPYGWIVGGYRHLFLGVSPLEAVVTAFVLLFITLPATLPFLSALWLWRRPPLNVVALLASGSALVLSSYPRWDLIHLNYVAPLSYALAASLIFNFRFRTIVAGTTLVVAVCCLGIAARQRWSEPSQATAIGAVHGPPADLQAIAMFQRYVHPSDTLFVFPYRPIVNFVTLTRNPTRYSFLFPGWDFSQALEELRTEPPHWVVYMDIPGSEFVRIWPGSDPNRMRMPGIESFIRERYRKVDQVSDFQLLELRGTIN